MQRTKGLSMFKSGWLFASNDRCTKKRNKHPSPTPIIGPVSSLDTRNNPPEKKPWFSSWFDRICRVESKTFPSLLIRRLQRVRLGFGMSPRLSFPNFKRIDSNESQNFVRPKRFWQWIVWLAQLITKPRARDVCRNLWPGAKEGLGKLWGLWIFGKIHRR